MINSELKSRTGTRNIHSMTDGHASGCLDRWIAGQQDEEIRELVFVWFECGSR